MGVLRWVNRSDWFCSSLINQLHVTLHTGGYKVPFGVCLGAEEFHTKRMHWKGSAKMRWAMTRSLD